MKPLYLYINNFTCHATSEIHFTNFNTALIAGNQDNNERLSSGAGKTSIFKAIEYVLFNQVRDPLQDKDILLEDLILEGTDRCRIVFDFQINEDIYRIVRCRTIKNITDLSFFKRSTVNLDQNPHTIETQKDLWIDMSSRRAQDTELDLSKIIRTHHKAFINTYYFMQFDFTSGLAAATPAHRKAILREALDLLVYAKLEKMAKNNADVIQKDIEKKHITLTTLGDPALDILELQAKLITVKQELEIIEQQHQQVKEHFDTLNQEREQYNLQLSVLEAQSSSIILKRDQLISEIDKLTKSISEYTTKSKRLVDQAKQTIQEVGQLKQSQSKLEHIDFGQIEILKTQLHQATIQMATLKSQGHSLNDQLEELKVPMPADGTCKHCRQLLTEEHRQACQTQIDQEIKETKQKIIDLKQQYEDASTTFTSINIQIKELERQQSSFRDISNKINTLDKDVFDKKSLHGEYSKLIANFTTDLTIKQEELERVKVEVSNSSSPEIIVLKNKIANNKSLLQQATHQLQNIQHNQGDLTNKQAVLLHSIEDKQLAISQKNDLEQQINVLDHQYAMYPTVIQAFGATGIPSLIIQNILEDLQTEANTLLAQLRPGLQLGFKIEKTKEDGTNADTLDIEYFLNNRARRYNMLSGGQKVCIMFALKMGLSFVLQKMMGSQIGLLMFDEIDQPFDDNGIDAFADIIRMFQKDFTILVITHRNELKEYFKNVILVEQDQNMISTTRMITR